MFLETANIYEVNVQNKNRSFNRRMQVQRGGLLDSASYSLSTAPKHTQR